MASTLEPLLAMERTLKEWIGIDQGAAFLDSVHQDTASIPPALSGASPEAIAAGTLHSIEIAAKLLREKLGIPLTARASVRIIDAELSPPLPRAEETNQPQD